MGKVPIASLAVAVVFVGFAHGAVRGTTERYSDVRVLDGNTVTAVNERGKRETLKLDGRTGVVLRDYRLERRLDGKDIKVRHNGRNWKGNKVFIEEVE